MSNFLKTLFGMSKESAREADTALAKKLATSNPRIALEADLTRRKAKLQEWTQRLIEGERAVVEDERETAEAEAESRLGHMPQYPVIDDFL